jgi:hypothetical protein
LDLEYNGLQGSIVDELVKLRVWVICICQTISFLECCQNA